MSKDKQQSYKTSDKVIRPRAETDYQGMPSPQTFAQTDDIYKELAAIEKEKEALRIRGEELRSQLPSTGSDIYSTIPKASASESPYIVIPKVGTNPPKAVEAESPSNYIVIPKADPDAPRHEPEAAPEFIRKTPEPQPTPNIPESDSGFDLSTSSNSAKPQETPQPEVSQTPITPEDLQILAELTKTLDELDAQRKSFIEAQEQAATEIPTQPATPPTRSDVALGEAFIPDTEKPTQQATPNTTPDTQASQYSAIAKPQQPTRGPIPTPPEEAYQSMPSTEEPEPIYVAMPAMEDSTKVKDNDLSEEYTMAVLKSQTETDKDKVDAIIGAIEKRAMEEGYKGSKGLQALEVLVKDSIDKARPRSMGMLNVDSDKARPISMTNMLDTKSDIAIEQLENRLEQVQKAIQQEKDIVKPELRFFKRGEDFDWLANTSPAPITFKMGNQTFNVNSSEHIFQAMKFVAVASEVGSDTAPGTAALKQATKILSTPDIGGIIQGMGQARIDGITGQNVSNAWDREVNPNQFAEDSLAFDLAKIYGEKHSQYSKDTANTSGLTVKEMVMCNVLLMKYTQNPSMLKSALEEYEKGSQFVEDTGARRDQSKVDTFWGDGKRDDKDPKGRNALGVAHMVVLEYLKQELEKNGAVQVHDTIDSSIASIMNPQEKDMLIGTASKESVTRETIQSAEPMSKATPETKKGEGVFTNSLDEVTRKRQTAMIYQRAGLEAPKTLVAQQPIAQPSTATQEKPGKLTVFLDVDGTLCDGRGYNDKFIDALVAKGIKNVTLMTSMDSADLLPSIEGLSLETGKFPTGGPSRAQLIEHLKSKGITVDAVVTPLDQYVDSAPGSVWKDKFVPLIDEFSKLTKEQVNQVFEYSANLDLKFDVSSTPKNIKFLYEKMMSAKQEIEALKTVEKHEKLRQQRADIENSAGVPMSSITEKYVMCQKTIADVKSKHPNNTHTFMLADDGAPNLRSAALAVIGENQYEQTKKVQETQVAATKDTPVTYVSMDQRLNVFQGDDGTKFVTLNVSMQQNSTINKDYDKAISTAQQEAGVAKPKLIDKILNFLKHPIQSTKAFFAKDDKATEATPANKAPVHETNAPEPTNTVATQQPVQQATAQPQQAKPQVQQQGHYATLPPRPQQPTTQAPTPQTVQQAPVRNVTERKEAAYKLLEAASTPTTSAIPQFSPKPEVAQQQATTPTTSVPPQVTQQNAYATLPQRATQQPTTHKPTPFTERIHNTQSNNQSIGH